MLHTELSVVNDMLALLGEAPINDLDAFHPMVPRALQTLRTVSGEVQTRKWWFNDVPTQLTPQADTGFILLPADTVSVDTYEQWPSVAQVGNRLFNVTENTFVFTKPTWVQLQRELDFNSLPNSARAYIATVAQLRFQNPIDGDATKTTALKEQKRETYMVFNAEHIRRVQANMLHRPGVLYATYKIAGRRAIPNTASIRARRY